MPLMGEASDTFSRVSNAKRPIIMTHHSVPGLQCGRRNLAAKCTDTTQL